MNNLTQAIELINKQESKEDVIRDGLSALASINQSCHAVSTKNRFNQFCKEGEITYFDKDFFDSKEPFIFDGKTFELEETFRQTGYGAWHIGSRIDEARRKGKNIIIVNAARNRRFLLREVKHDKVQ